MEPLLVDDDEEDDDTLPLDDELAEPKLLPVYAGPDVLPPLVCCTLLLLPPRPLLLLPRDAYAPLLLSRCPNEYGTLLSPCTLR